MFSKKKMNEFTGGSLDKTALIREKIQQADAIVIGAGAGLSTAAGFTYSGERFEKYFADFGEKYGFFDMYSGGFYNYDTLEHLREPLHGSAHRFIQTTLSAGGKQGLFRPHHKCRSLFSKGGI